MYNIYIAGSNSSVSLTPTWLADPEKTPDPLFPEHTYQFRECPFDWLIVLLISLSFDSGNGPVKKLKATAVRVVPSFCLGFVCNEAIYVRIL